ncbi:hypothetical protein IFT98_02655 [Pseudomonas sp. CFBP 8770]|uniref:hypothetical protein n=1 Tax=unclassified Pseudomonas TaxID=196821 RepID=UPI0017821D5F|nr:MULTISPECIES: hypothetical protein [unclassified Pseudomonas]MBD8473015.1 hypothetical protein [Pseudomonas sp. CFBP 8773]MBD8645882.1 hypothetical protein [Pseudomonas sp. CFBP 8770]
MQLKNVLKKNRIPSCVIRLTEAADPKNAVGVPWGSPASPPAGLLVIANQHFLSQLLAQRHWRLDLFVSELVDLGFAEFLFDHFRAAAAVCLRLGGVNTLLQGLGLALRCVLGLGIGRQRGSVGREWKHQGQAGTQGKKSFETHNE